MKGEHVRRKGRTKVKGKCLKGFASSVPSRIQRRGMGGAEASTCGVKHTSVIGPQQLDIQIRVARLTSSLRGWRHV